MVKAFVLITAEKSGQVSNIAEEVKNISEVKISLAVSGPYDVITYVEVENLQRLGDLVLKKIQAIPGVGRTLTCVGVEI